MGWACNLTVETYKHTCRIFWYCQKDLLMAE